MCSNFDDIADGSNSVQRLGDRQNSLSNFDSEDNQGSIFLLQQHSEHVMQNGINIRGINADFYDDKVNNKVENVKSLACSQSNFD